LDADAASTVPDTREQTGSQQHARPERMPPIQPKRRVRITTHQSAPARQAAFAEVSQNAQPAMVGRLPPTAGKGRVRIRDA